jgi:hypothetical protein
VEKQSKDVGGDLEAAEMPLKAGMWRRGMTAGTWRWGLAAVDAPAAGYGGGDLEFGGRGNARLSQ